MKQLIHYFSVPTNSHSCQFQISIRTFCSTGKIGELERGVNKINEPALEGGEAYPSPVTGSHPLAVGKPGPPQPGLLPDVMSVKASGC